MSTINTYGSIESRSTQNPLNISYFEKFKCKNLDNRQVKILTISCIGTAVFLASIALFIKAGLSSTHASILCDQRDTKCQIDAGSINCLDLTSKCNDAKNKTGRLMIGAICVLGAMPLMFIVAEIFRCYQMNCQTRPYHSI
ncbi:MAG: hypothetical protein JHC93_08450 [Parachlamydiales bacterium]|nr:hypothetical protein [Parachlamydiales bacterium]